MTVSSAEYRVYYEDTDAGGIMYHGNFINFCERARSDLMRDIGYPCSEVAEKLKIGFVVANLNANYLKMVRLDDLLRVETSVIKLKNTSFVMNQSIFEQNSPVFTMEVTLVCVDIAGKPTKIPEELRDKFEDYRVEEE